MTTRIRRMAALVLCAAALLLAARRALAGAPPTRPSQPAKVQITVSKETTYLLGPLNQDGTVNCVAALNERYSKGVSKDNNAAVLLLQSFGPQAIHKDVRQEILKQLKLGPLPEGGQYFVTLKDYAARKGGAAGEDLAGSLGKAMAGPWSANQRPQIAAWLKLNEKPLAGIVTAAKRTRYYAPLVALGRPDILGLPDPSLHREGCKALIARAMLQARQGDLEAAWGDLMAIHRVARLVAQSPTFLDRFVSVVSESTACEADLDLLHASKATPRQLRRFLGDLGSLSSLPDILESFDQFERIAVLDIVVACSRGTPSTVLGRVAQQDMGDLQPFDRISLDWDIVLKSVNSWFDRFTAAGRKESFAQRKAAFAKLDEDVQAVRQASAALVRDVPAGIAKVRAAARGDANAARKGLSRAFGNLMVGILFAWLERPIELYDEARMRLDLVRVGVALAAWRAEKGGYPAKLSDLSPAYIREVPNDLFTDGELRYTRADKGYLLYSVGPDMKDNGGRGPTQDSGDYDVAVRVD